ncbi:MAG: GntR family transcriptional regulator [Verrucomicrobiota bacterium]
MDRFLPDYKKVANLVRRRILHGSYALKSIPSERQMAEEIGVNFMSVRRGLKLLEQGGLIQRNAKGRIEIKRAKQGNKKHFNIGLLMPTSSSAAMGVWRVTIEKACADLPCNIRPVLFLHWDDPILSRAIDGFDGIFLSPIPHPLPESLAERIRPPGNPVVVIDHDFTNHGIPSIQIFPPIFIHNLLDHLKKLGHSKIGCLNTQPDNSEIRERINQWRYWKESHQFSGQLADHPVLPHDNPILQAHRVMTAILAGERSETAWFCTTTPTALGAMSAMLDHQLQPGRDLAICAANGEGIARMLNPPLTALESQTPAPFITRSLEWMMRGGQNWRGPLLMRPKEVPLVIRASTVPEKSAPPPSAPLRKVTSPANARKFKTQEANNAKCDTVLFP